MPKYWSMCDREKTNKGTNLNEKYSNTRGMNIFWERMYLTGHKFKRLLNSRALDQQKKEHFKQHGFEQLPSLQCLQTNLCAHATSLTWQENRSRFCGLRMLSRFTRVRLYGHAWSDCQAPLSMGFFRQEHCNGVSFPSPGDLPNSGIEPVSVMAPELVGGFLTISATWEALLLQVKSKHMETSPVLRLLLCFASLEM